MSKKCASGLMYSLSLILVEGSPVRGLRMVLLSKRALNVLVSTMDGAGSSEKPSSVKILDFWAPPPPAAKPYNQQSTQRSQGLLVLSMHSAPSSSFCRRPKLRKSSLPVRRSTAVFLRLEITTRGMTS